MDKILFYVGLGVLFLDFLLTFAVFVLLKKSSRKARNAEVRRREVFTLPDRENTFVRDRLNTNFSVSEPQGEYGLEDGKLRLNHVRELLTKLKSASLSPSDRLETESLSRLITVYASKDLLTGKELRELNDCLSVVLKLTAKYAV